MYPTMPHTMKSPKVENGGKAPLHQGNTGFQKTLYVRSSSFLALNPSVLTVRTQTGRFSFLTRVKGAFLVLTWRRKQFLAGAGHRDRLCVPNVAAVPGAERFDGNDVANL